ncbi:CRISPR-associated endonuclease Cas3'' [Frankia sp. ArI3]|uniref:CRISPR-associated endonuclease Cas3'' n=1 Tax=Frankia sp. ArI3 TaxID=1858 RepID=UPI002106B8F6|nr:CRISPR-associated endonuclease Cas3'' [Frankia sp. ArI3]
MHLLLGHLLDTAAVGELVWDRYLAPVIRERLDAVSDGQGRALFALVCGLHDVGKATPAFQMKDDGLAARVRAAGFDWKSVSPQQGRRWHHARAGAVILRGYLPQVGWSRQACNWVWPLVAGHHGRIPGRDRLVNPGVAHGVGLWPQAQQAFVDRVAADLGVDLPGLGEARTPSRGDQLTLSGLIIMADWIASDHTHFGGLSDPTKVSMAAARDRARKAWEELGLRGGWRRPNLVPVDQHDLVRHRFGKAARAAQSAAVELARDMPGAGLLILEAPMGEGKTEAAFAAAGGTGREGRRGRRLCRNADAGDQRPDVQSSACLARRGRRRGADRSAARPGAFQSRMGGPAQSDQLRRGARRPRRLRHDR